VLFSDIRGFTTLSERKTPQEIVDILNRYFSLQVEIIFRHQGTLDKYIGDAIMAFWGAPTEQPDHARRALLAARDMEQALLRFKQELGEEGGAFDIGIGLNSGEAVVGFIGSPEHRQDYTVIGDTVNTASRIEGATKDRARILVSDATRHAVGDICRFRDHGEVRLKGKGEAVRLFEPIWDNTP
jgi:adenylate cyclase